MKLRSLHACVASIFMSIATPGFSMSLDEALALAISNDPQYQADKQIYLASSLEKRLALADLLPQVNYTRTEGKSKYERSLVNGSSAPVVDDVDTLNEQITVVQQVINLEAWNRFKAGSSISELAVQQFRSSTLDLYLKLTDLYFEAIAARQAKSLADSEVTFYAEQVKLTENGLASGESSELDVLSAQAELDLARANQMESVRVFSTAILKLESVVGQKIESLQSVSTDFDLPDIETRDFASIENEAKTKNPLIRAAALQVEISQNRLDQQIAGHYPALDVVYSRSKTANDTVNTINTENDIDGVSFRLSVPLFSGLKVDTLAKQASAQLAQSEFEYLSAQKEVLVALQEAFIGVRHSKPRIQAYKTRVNSAQMALEAAELGLQAGVNVFSDVLQARRDLFQSKRDLQKVQLEAVTSSFNLYALIGKLNFPFVRVASTRLGPLSPIDIDGMVRPDHLDVTAPSEILTIEVDNQTKLPTFSIK